MRKTSRWAFCASLGLAGRLAGAVTPVEIQERGDVRLVLDGVVREWSELTPVEDAPSVLVGPRSWSGRDDASFSFAMARDAEALWVAVEVRDERVTRSREHRTSEDALVLSFAHEQGSGRAAWELALQPGVPGEYAGAVSYRGGRSGPVPGASVVEAPTGSGYMLEARIPWSALGAVSANFRSLRARLAYHDADAGARVESVIATGPGDAERNADLALTVNAVQLGGINPGADLVTRFRADRGLAAVNPVLDRRVNLAGDASPERLVVFPNQMMVSGPGVGDGARYSFVEFPTGPGVTLSEVDTRDLTADGRAEILVRFRVPTGDFSREVLHLYALDAAGNLAHALAHETQRDSGPNRVTNSFAPEAGGRVRVATLSAVGYSASNYPAAVESGVEPALTPWGPERARVYLWNPAASRFVFERAEPNPRAQAGAASAPAAPGAQALPTPVAPPNIESLLTLFRQRENLGPQERPQFQASGNVAEDAQPETVMIFQRTLVVVGPGYLGGRNYYQLGLPLNEGDAVLSLALVDLNGDGLAEALLRVRRNVTSTIQGTAVASQREMLLGYGLGAQRGRIFAAEVARTVGANSARVNAIVPTGGGREITLEAGAVTGWTQASYPFHDAPPNGFFALLLPWSTPRRVTYRWSGTAFVAAP